MSPRGGSGKSKGNAGRGGVRPACAAGSRQGTRPLDPDFACGRDWCGALFSDAEIREDMIYDIILNTLTGQFSKALDRALDSIYHGIG